MSNIRVWAFSGIAAVALGVGALMAGGAVSFAQDGSTTPTPSATTAPSDSSGGTATPAPHTPGGHNCPNMGANSSSSGSSSSGSSTTPNRYNTRSVTSSAPRA